MTNGAAVVRDLACLAWAVDRQHEQTAAGFQSIRDEADPAAVRRPARFPIGVARPGQAARIRAIDTGQPDLTGATVQVFVSFRTCIDDLCPVRRHLRVTGGYTVVPEWLRGPS